MDKTMDHSAPSLRFPGFSGNWELRPFREIACLRNGVRLSGQQASSLPSKTPCIELEHLESGTGVILGSGDVSRSLAVKHRFYRGDVLFGKLRPNLRKFARPDFDGVCSQEIWVLDGIAVCNSFLYQLIQTPRFGRAAMAASGTRMPRADWNLVSASLFPIPSLKEQRMIADFLQAADLEIREERRIIECLREKRTGILQEIFCDSSRWDSVPLSSILTERKTYARKGETYPHLSLTKDGVIPKTARYDRDFLVKKQDKAYKITLLDDICYNPANLKFGVICRNRLGNGIFSPIYVTFSVNPGFVPGFVELLVTRPGFLSRALQYEEGTVYERMAVKPEHLLSLRVPVPSPERQREIAGLAELLDEQIMEETSVLRSLTMRKKGLLEGMFP